MIAIGHCVKRQGGAFTESTVNLGAIHMHDFTYLDGLTADNLREIYRWAHWRDDDHCKALADECKRRLGGES